MKKYSCQLENGEYYFFENGRKIYTPRGLYLETRYKPLADRILSDLNTRGFDYRSSSSVISWHCTLIDSFMEMSREQVVMILMTSFVKRRDDWTYMARWKDPNVATLFDYAYERNGYIHRWLEKCTHMQLTAACCIGNAFESINLAFVLAMLMEEYSETELDKVFMVLAERVAECYPYDSAESMYHDFKTFELYYGIHLKESGPVMKDDIPDPIPYTGYAKAEKKDTRSYNADDLTGKSISIEDIIGRNFYHYANGEIIDENDDEDEKYLYGDLYINEIDNDDMYDDDDEDEEDDEETVSEDIGDYLPDDCWIKRYVNEYEPDSYYILYIVHDGDKITDAGILQETVSRDGGGMIVLPGMELPCTKMYEEIADTPDCVSHDIEMLMKGRVLKRGMSFTGNKMPKNFNGDSYELPSAFRQTRSTIRYGYDEQRIIRAIYYSTYQTSSNGFANMVTRPVFVSDQKNEARDMLLYLLDMYTDEEYKVLVFDVEEGEYT